MNFALATLTLALATSTMMMATGAQARVMRGTSTAELGRELEEVDLSLSLSMPNSEKLVAAEELLAFPFDAGSNYTAAEQQQFTERFQKTALGAAITEWLKKNPEAAAASASSSSSSVSSSSAGKSGKIGFCDQILEDFYQAYYNIFDFYPPSPELVTKACSFGGTDFYVDDDDDASLPRGVYYNTGCPVVAYPILSGDDDNYVGGVDGGYFLDKENEYDTFLGPFGPTAWKLNEYCECHQGYELGCASKIPYPEYGPDFGFNPKDSSQVAGPYLPNINVYPGDNHKKWEEYCKFVAIWNGDVTSSPFESAALFEGLSKEVRECGCFFIASAEGMVGECPAVSLFEYFDFADDDAA